MVLDATAMLAVLDGRGRIDEHLVTAELLLAPDLVVSETLNVCWKLTRAGRPAPATDVVLAQCRRIAIVPAAELAAEAMILATTLDHSVYDCLYAALAKREGARLITADRRFAAKLVGFDVAVFSV